MSKVRTACKPPYIMISCAIFPGYMKDNPVFTWKKEFYVFANTY